MTEDPRSFEELLLASMAEAVAIARGETQPARITTARRVSATPAPRVRGDGVRALRTALGLSQPVFAAALNVGAETVKAWEQGKRTPDGAALRLLELARENPSWLLDRVTPRPTPSVRSVDAMAHAARPPVYPPVARHPRPAKLGQSTLVSDRKAGYSSGTATHVKQNAGSPLGMRSKSAAGGALSQSGMRSKSAAGSALSQAGVPSRETTRKAASKSSSTLRHEQSSKTSKSAAGSALSQRQRGGGGRGRGR